MQIFQRLELLFGQIEAKTGLKKHRILLEVGLDPAQYRAYKRANRLPSMDMLHRLSTFPSLSISRERLLAWRALDEFGPGVLLEAQAILQAEALAGPSSV